eukprot:CAMPEP_0172409932 /NCGR_PEP_ID=MMETSP1061-20121228/76617_1 /TAXON_ID=37318 /ORGANISM="Pseudo-nitzschia pungens, Strain cf. pungens" /LENGTH=287 /DNA_ID=CAMNT_0013146097 /DNA_START=106 /DNA_END=968 /DNA_ORIENTATION=+
MTSHSLFAKSERRISSSSSSSNSHSRTAHSNHRRPSSSRHPKSMYIPQALFNAELTLPPVLTPRNELFGNDHKPEDSNNDGIIANTAMMSSHLMTTLRHDIIINNNNNNNNNNRRFVEPHTIRDKFAKNIIINNNNNNNNNRRFVEPHTIRDKFCQESAAPEPKPTTFSSTSCLSSTASRKRSATSVLTDALSILKAGPHHHVSDDESGGIDALTRSNSGTMNSIVSLCTSLSSPPPLSFDPLRRKLPQPPSEGHEAASAPRGASINENLKRCCAQLRTRGQSQIMW